MNNFDKFIDTYKELEKECRAKEKDIKDYEDELAEDVSAKLRMCRYFRNYIQHYKGYEKFLSITPDMQSFLEKTLKNVVEADDIVKKHLIGVKAISCDLNDKAQDALAKISKNKKDFILAFDKNEFKGLIYVYDIIALNKAEKLRKIKKISRNFYFVKPTNKINDVDTNCINICKEKDKILGVIK